MKIPHEVTHLIERVLERAIEWAVHHRAWATAIGVAAGLILFEYLRNRRKKQATAPAPELSPTTVVIHHADGRVEELQGWTRGDRGPAPPKVSVPEKEERGQ